MKISLQQASLWATLHAEGTSERLPWSTEDVIDDYNNGAEYHEKNNPIILREPCVSNC